MSGIDDYLGKSRSVTCFDLANRFNIRMSIARKLLREKEAKGELVAYIREGGFIVYTTPSEMEKRESGVPIMTAAVFEKVASSVTAKPVITEEMDEALVAAGTPGAVKPSKLAHQRREHGKRKERKDDRPEVIVEPLEAKPAVTPEPVVAEKKAPAKKKPAKKEAKPKKADAKKTTKKATDKKEAKPKKPAAKKDEKPKKAAAKKTTKKAADKKEAKPKKATTKKAADKKDAKPKKAAAKKTTTKKTADKKEAKPKKKTTKKKSE